MQFISGMNAISVKKAMPDAVHKRNERYLGKKIRAICGS